MSRDGRRGRDPVVRQEQVRPRARREWPATKVVARGVVEQGVELTSIVLHDLDGGRWQLGRSWSHLTGCAVEVVGRARRDLKTTAQEGVVLTVEQVTVLSGTPRSEHPDAEGGPGMFGQ